MTTNYSISLITRLVQDALPKPPKVADILDRIKQALKDEDFSESYRLWYEADHLIHKNLFPGRAELDALETTMVLGWEFEGFIKNVFHRLSAGDWEGALSELNGATEMFERSKITFPVTYNKIQMLGTSIKTILASEGKRSKEHTPVKPIFGKTLDISQYHSDVFMLMPFAEAFSSIYDVIATTVRSLGWTIKCSDYLFSKHSIMTDIWSALNKCEIVLADCTGRNANVFYEIGIAHTIGKTVILIAQSKDDIPSDLRHLRFILYENSSEGMNTLRTELVTVLSNLTQ